MSDIVSDDRKLRHHRVAFYGKEIKLIDKLLQIFLKKSQSKCALLIDTDGHLITTHGETQTYEMDALCTLLAGTFAATREWAKLLGESEFSVLFHQGKRDSIQVTLVGDRALLAVIFDDRTQLGLVRLMSAEVGKKLEEIFEQADSQPQEEGPMMDADFPGGAQRLLNELFGEDTDEPKEGG